MFRFPFTRADTLATSSLADSSAQQNALDASVELMNEGLKDAFCLYVERRGESEVINHCFETIKQVDILRGTTPRAIVCQAWIADYMPTSYAMPSMMRFAIGQRTHSDRLAERRACPALTQPDPQWQQAWNEAFDALDEEQYRDPQTAATYFINHEDFSSAVVPFGQALGLHRQRALRAGIPAAKQDDAQWGHLVRMYTQCLCQLRSTKGEAVVEMLAARHILKLQKHHIDIPPDLWAHTPRLVDRLLGEHGGTTLHQKLTALHLWGGCHAAYDGVVPDDLQTLFAKTQKRIVDAFEQICFLDGDEMAHPKLFDNIRPANAPLVTQNPAYAGQPPLALFDLPGQAEQFMESVKQGNTARRALLLHGAPGTGKTSLAEAIMHDLCSAENSNVYVYRLNPNEVLSSHFSESVANITAIIKSLSREKNRDGTFRKVIIKIDEVDRLQGRRKAGESAENKRITTCLFDAFDNSSAVFDRLYLIATTNLPDEIDDAMMRRYAFKAEVAMPTKNTYRNILAHCAKRWPRQAWADLDEKVRDDYLWHCEGVSAGDLVQHLSADGIVDQDDVCSLLTKLTWKRLMRQHKDRANKETIDMLRSGQKNLQTIWEGMKQTRIKSEQNSLAPSDNFREEMKSRYVALMSNYTEGIRSVESYAREMDKWLRDCAF